MRWKFAPFMDCAAMREALARLMHDPRFTPARVLQVLRRDAIVETTLMVDVYTTAEEIVVQASLPGLKPKDIEIKLDHERLTIRGRFPVPLVNVTYVLQERQKGYFCRILALNVPVDGSRAEARLVDGVLTLVLPRVQEPQTTVHYVRPK
ncbi:MAG: Hsp20 family protein [Anaerolineae bacterium]|nr:Hsp20 family protein [Anaerolineae bacterium]